MMITNHKRESNDIFKLIAIYRYSIWTAAVCMLVSFFFIQVSKADIYTYIDENGVRHFSNVPTSGKYKLYVRSASNRPTEFRSTSKFDRYITKASRTHGIEFNLVKAVIKAESDFDPKAVSRKGAKGLMQIMPDNFQLLSIQNPFNPDQNIMGGTKYLKYLMKKFEGELSLTLAAYNAGPQAVEKYNGIPPYTETRDYVKKVLQYYRHYQKSL